MPQFTDSTGRTWPVGLNVLKIKQVKETLGVNLLDVINENCDLLARIYEDPLFLADLLYLLLADELAARNADADDLCRLLDSGEVQERAAAAVAEAIADFFPSARTRAITREILAKADQLQEKIHTTMMAKLEQVPLDQLVDQCIASASSSPASSASSPGDSPSANSPG